MTDRTRYSDFTFNNSEGTKVFVHRWEPSGIPARAAILVVHGAAEHGLRYERTARVLNAAGYSVYAPDHRGHGRTAGVIQNAGWAGPDGWNGMVRDLEQLSRRICELTPELPFFLFGHSMGSFLTQRFIQKRGAELRGAILSGSAGTAPGLDDLISLAKAAAQDDAARQPSEMFRSTFVFLNHPFAPGETGLEWLSRDKAEVQKYVDDPWCGFDFSNRLYADMLEGVADTWNPENEALVPVDLPLLIFSGTMDTVGGALEYLEELVRRYRDLGIRDLEVKYYTDGRHEMLNETNRDEVHRDILDWLERHL